MLSIEKLNVSVGDKKILKDFNLKIGKGEIHAIMGPNGSGKSVKGNTKVLLSTGKIRKIKG